MLAMVYVNETEAVIETKAENFIDNPVEGYKFTYTAYFCLVP